MTVGQAVREPRPLRRRPVTMARPARVRMRNRKPWTLARRRLFGWKVRLPLATAVSPRHIWRTRSRGRPAHPGRATAPLLSCSANRRGPGYPVAAVSPMFGRRSRVLRSLPQVKPHCSAQRRGLRSDHRLTCWHPCRNLLASGRAGSTGHLIAELPAAETTYRHMLRTRSSPALCTPVDNYVDSFRTTSVNRGLTS